MRRLAYHCTRGHITDCSHERWTRRGHGSKFNQPRKYSIVHHHVVPPERVCSWNSVFYETALCIYFFIYLSSSALYDFLKKKKKRNDSFWRKLRLCKKCSGGKKKNLRCRHAVTGCSIEIQEEDAILYFLDLRVLVSIIFLSVKMQNLQEKHEAVNFMNK